MSRVVDRLFLKCGPDRFRRLRNVSRETFGGLENQPVKRVGEPVGLLKDYFDEGRPAPGGGLKC